MASTVRQPNKTAEMARRRVFIVYLISNLIDGKKYIGKASGRNFAVAVKRRWNEHLRCARNGGGWRLHRAMRKHGVHNFQIGYLYICQTERGAFALEVREIARLRPEYNMTKGGEGVAGDIEVRQKISKALTGICRGPMSEDHKQKLRQAFLGKPKTSEHAHNISLGKAGKPYHLTKPRTATIAINLAKESGSKFYSTGNPCKQGHFSQRYVSTRQCCECHRIRFLQNPSMSQRHMETRHDRRTEDRSCS